VGNVIAARAVDAVPSNVEARAIEKVAERILFVNCERITCAAPYADSH
jgi:hypothetical protein